MRYAYRCSCFIVTVIAMGMLFGFGPSKTPGKKAVNNKRFEVVNTLPKLDPDQFRCIVVGDSQTTGPNSNGIRTQMHGWDSNFVGDLVTVGNNAAGYEMSMSGSSSANLGYRTVDIYNGWDNGGQQDFFAVVGHEWICVGDIQSNGARIARMRLNFSVLNQDSPWDTDWGVGQNILARIAVRTTPTTVRAIETRPERGEVSVGQLAQVHELEPTWGIQIIEQQIPGAIDRAAERVGVGLYFPEGYVEEEGMRLQVLGVTFHRADLFWNVEKGTFIGYQGRGSFSVSDHLYLFSQKSRETLVEMTDADTIVIMLGHNAEPGGILSYEDNLIKLSNKWDAAFDKLYRPRPKIIYVAPWGTGTSASQPYMNSVNNITARLGADGRKRWCVSLFDRYRGLSPEVYSPEDYNMDFWHVHAQDGPTARRIADDLYELLFNPDKLIE